MPAIITNKFRINNAEQFLESFTEQVQISIIWVLVNLKHTQLKQEVIQEQKILVQIHHH